MAERWWRARRLTSLLAWAPTAAALAIILLTGVYAGIEVRQEDVKSQRAAVRDRLDEIRATLEAEIGLRFEAMRALAGAVTAEPQMDAARFKALAAVLGSVHGATDALALARPGRVPVVYPPDRGLADLVATLADTQGEAGMGAVPGAEGPTFLAWVPVPALTGDAQARVVARLDAPQILTDAGLAGAHLGLETALTPIVPGAAAARPFFGPAALLQADPVSVVVVLPQGAWRLWGQPAGGWKLGGWSGWQVPPLTAVAAFLILGPILQNRRLNATRRRILGQLRAHRADLVRISRRLELALKTSQIGVWSLDLRSARLDWDQRTEEIYDLAGTGAPHTTETWSAALHPQDRARAEAEIDAAIRGNGRYGSSFRIRHRDGRTRHIRATGSVYRERGRRAQVVGVHWDVTEDVLRNAELETKRHEAEAASVAKSQFLANMSHEIRTPLNGVLGMLDLLLRSALGPEQRERALVAHDSARHLLTILNDILDFSKIEARALRLEPAQVDVARLVRDVVALFVEEACARGPALSALVDPGLPPRLVCDPARLRQVLMNLVANAVKFTDAGRIEVRARHLAEPGGGRLAVAVRDTGIGISQVGMAQLFQRFAQGDASSTRARGGTGLGLAISQQLVEAMGGEIVAESVEGSGSIFSFTIGAEIGEPAPERAAPAQADEAPLRILVAEDNATNQQILTAYLAKAGHVVRMVGDGVEVVAEAAIGGHDLVLMDVQMPRMDGITAARRIRALPGAAGRVPIIALTANAMPGDRETYLAAGMCDHLSKPIVPHTLFAAIARWAPQPQEAAEPVRRVAS